MERCAISLESDKTFPELRDEANSEEDAFISAMVMTTQMLCRLLSDGDAR